MLNREKYAEEIMDIACEGGNIALINGKLEKCRGVCDKCDFCDNDIRNACLLYTSPSPRDRG